MKRSKTRGSGAKSRLFGGVVLSTLMLAVGCGNGQDHDANADGGGHGHHHEAPHGGALVGLGDHVAFLEFVLEEASGLLTMYVLDGGAQNGYQIAQPSVSLEVKIGENSVPLVLQGVESTLSGEKIGNTSQFQVTSDSLKGIKEFEATIASIELKGQKWESLTFPFPEGKEH